MLKIIIFSIFLFILTWGTANIIEPTLDPQPNYSAVQETNASQQKELNKNSLPVDKKYFSISSGFGYRKDPFTSERSFHSGIDISSPGIENTKAYTIDPGTIHEISYNNRAGNYIFIEHDDYFTIYAHLNKILVEESQKVEAGEAIGTIGDTGRSTGAHLHFEVHVDGQAVDPTKLLKKQEKEN